MDTYGLQSGATMGVSRSNGLPMVLLQCEEPSEPISSILSENRHRSIPARIVLTLGEAEQLIEDLQAEIANCRKYPKGIGDPNYVSRHMEGQ